MKNFLLLFFIAYSGLSLKAQAPVIHWQRSLGGTNDDLAYSIIQISDSGYVTVGMTASTNGDVSGNNGGSGDYWVAKLSNTGGLKWTNCFGGTSSEQAMSVVESVDGGYVIAGHTRSTNGDVTLNHGVHDFWIVKTDTAGTLLWQKSFGGTGEDKAFSIIQAADSGYVVAGFTNSVNGDITNPYGQEDCWVVKLSKTGMLQWQKTYGGTLSDVAADIIQTHDGGYALAGYTKSNDGDVSGNHGGNNNPPDAWVVKLDNTGAVQWQKCLGGLGTDAANSIIQTASGNFLVASEVYSGTGDITGYHGSGDMWIVNLDTAGDILWQKCYGGNNADVPLSIVECTDNGFAVGGHSSSADGDVSGGNGGFDYWMFRADSAGTMLWQKPLGGADTDYGRSLVKTGNEAYTIAGYALSIGGDITNNIGGNDFWLVHLDTASIITNAGAADNTTAREITLYPNPAANSLLVNTNTPETLKVSIYTLTGILLIDKYLTSGQPIDISSLAAGFYLAGIKTKDTRIIKRWLKE